MTGSKLSTQSLRNQYRLNTLDLLLRNNLVAEAICEVDRQDVYTLQCPYSSTPSVTVQALLGTYSVATVTTTDSTLTVADEFICPEHIFDFEQVLSRFDVFANRTDEQMYQVAYKIDQFVLNTLANGAGGAYTTPAGGFTTASNVITICANLISKVAGFADNYKGQYLVVENTDLVGILPAQATNGFAYADDALKNGLKYNIMGIDIYVVRSGTFTTATIGTLSATNASCRLFGIKKTCTYASPRGIRFEEKQVSGKTGMEIVTIAYCGAKVWAAKAPLTVKITLA